MTTDLAKYESDAMAALEKVKTDQDLTIWHDDWCNADPAYLQLPERAVRRLEDGFQRKLSWIYGVGAG